jgi:hypothetical protein
MRVLPAFADAHAPVRGLGKRAAIVRIAEEQVLRRRWRPVRAQPQMLVKP